MSRELLVIEAKDVTIILKGALKEAHFEKFHQNVSMHFAVTGAPCTASIYDYGSQDLVEFTGQPLAPIFFENGVYELLILPEGDADFAFDHEYESFKTAVTKMSRANILSGNLDFRNEVGLSEMTILKNGQPYITFTIEVFPTKLDYQKDYKALLEEVNAEIYNLAYSFIKKTYLRASRKQYKNPSMAEFYRILREHFNNYIKALNQIEQFPHHQLVTSYEEVRGERLRRQDSRGRNYLRKNASVFVDVQTGITVAGRTVLPQKGLLLKKKQTYDTHENRYVKWTMSRLISRLAQLKEKVRANFEARKLEPEAAVLDLIETMQNEVLLHFRKPFWRSIGQLDRSVYSLVLQMGTGYREVFQIYTFLSQSLVLHGDLYKMSVKDIATLYEYWSFLKLGQILAQKCEQVSQNIVHVDRGGLWVNLKANHTAKRVFKHPYTNEMIELKYQYHAGKYSQTVEQKPDTMLSIAKCGKDYAFQYIFDAKYRLKIDSNIGPINDDINTMHRYRDAIVAEQMNVYERLTFGAYVLFPWYDDEEYRKHPLFLSINKVNIGGLPFLPNNTDFVVNLLDNLLNKSGEQLQQQGILPYGTLSYLKLLEGNVLIVNCIATEQLLLPFNEFSSDLADVRYVGFADAEGVQFVSEVITIEKGVEGYFISLREPVAEQTLDYFYVIEKPIIVPRKKLQLAGSLAELFVPDNLVDVLRRLALQVFIQLDDATITQQSKVLSIEINDIQFNLFETTITNEGEAIDFRSNPDELFSWIVQRVDQHIRSEKSLPISTSS